MPKQVNIEGTVLPIEELHFSFITHALRHKFGFLESSRDNIPKDSNGEIIPLYTYPCYEWLNSIGWETSRVFEYGSGYSTLWWSNKGADVYGVEHDEEWFKKGFDFPYLGKVIRNLSISKVMKKDKEEQRIGNNPPEL